MQDLEFRTAEQKTGFGVKRFLICPNCGARRVKLVHVRGKTYCHGCAPFNVYAERCNLYDSGGTALIVYHLKKLARSAKITIRWPFDCMDHTFSKPAGMRWERWSMTLKKLQALEQMRFCAIFLQCRYTAKDIKERTSREVLEGVSLAEIEGRLPVQNTRAWAALQTGEPRANRGKIAN